MIRKVLCLILTLLLSLTCFTACNLNPKQMIQEVKAHFLSGDVNGKIGKTYSTAWFEFTINSIEEISEYEDYTPAEDSVLYDVVINEKNICQEKIFMGTYDFYMESSALSDPIFPLDPLDENMMPTQFGLAVDEVAEYHMVYEIPANVPDLALMFVEVDENGKEGSTFTIDIPQ